MKKIIKITTLLSVLTQGAFLHSANTLEKFNVLLGQSESLSPQSYDISFNRNYGVSVPIMRSHKNTWPAQLTDVQNALTANPTANITNAITFVEAVHAVGNTDLLKKVLPAAEVTYLGAWGMITDAANAPVVAELSYNQAVANLRNIFSPRPASQGSRGTLPEGYDFAAVTRLLPGHRAGAAAPYGLIAPRAANAPRVQETRASYTQVNANARLLAQAMERELALTNEVIHNVALPFEIDAQNPFAWNRVSQLSVRTQQLLDYLTGRIDDLTAAHLAAVATRDDHSDTDSDSDDSDLDNVTPAQRVNDLRSLFNTGGHPIADIITILNGDAHPLVVPADDSALLARVGGTLPQVTTAAQNVIKAMKDWIMDRHDADAIQIQDLEGQGANALQVLNATIGLLEVAIDKINENNFGARGVTPIHYDANTSLDNPTQLTRSIRLSLGEMSSFAALGVKVTPAAKGGLGMRIAQAGGQEAPAAEANSDLADLIKEIGKHNAMCQSFVENQGLFHMNPATARQTTNEGPVAIHVNEKSAAFRSKLIELMNATADLAEVADDRAGFDVNEHPIYSLQVNLSGATPEDPTTRLHSVNGVYTLAADQRIHSIALLSVPAPAAEADHDNGTHEQD